ncbi:PadR family transcriptional regulator [Micromonospora chokoriensis]|uniref:Virulence activator alpha C-term n=1 Tax=Micromonospora chokoriensis TaxID=356851 RepID=A0A1C4Y7V2_9ACTN|nr:PadR family transcriptional regulator [Micromonospora chokoriensis]SCF16716.1 Virulence activator alpha C-term [Micromonospora chokoriensis]
MQRTAVRWGLLALFADGPKYGYQLRTELEGRTGGSWAVNVGQIYTTLERLVRDGHVCAAGNNEDGRELFTITEQGRRSLDAWYMTPIADSDRPRSELAIKLAMAIGDPSVDITLVVQKQRTESMRQMRDYTDLRRHADDGEDVTWPLLLDHLIFALESEIRWLDHTEATVLRPQRHRSAAGPASATPQRFVSERVHG